MSYFPKVLDHNCWLLRESEEMKKYKEGPKKEVMLSMSEKNSITEEMQLENEFLQFRGFYILAVVGHFRLMTYTSSFTFSFKISVFCDLQTPLTFLLFKNIG